MKKNQKYILCGCLLSSVLALSGCTKEASGPEKEITLPPVTQAASTEPATKQPESTVAAPDESGRPVIHFYLPTEARTSRNLCTEYKSAWSLGKDIVVLEPLAFEESTHTGRNSQYAAFWMDLWNSYPKADECKVGYALSLTLADGSIARKTILSPADTKELFPYMEMYLYDDVHQIPGNWYSHLEENQMKENTLITSIKLTAGKQIEQVLSASVSVFVYKNENDFDAKGFFRGTHIATTALINTAR